MTIMELERDRIGSALRCTPLSHPRFHELYAAGCALAWASDPEMFSSPLDYIEGRTNREAISREVAKEDCPSLSHQASS
jgi:hypothetical protein